MSHGRMHYMVNVVQIDLTQHRLLFRHCNFCINKLYIDEVMPFKARGLLIVVISCHCMGGG